MQASYRRLARSSKRVLTLEMAGGVRACARNAIRQQKFQLGALAARLEVSAGWCGRDAATPARRYLSLRKDILELAPPRQSLG
jgi:hypothetical protein